MNITQENIDELNAVLKVKVVAEDYLPKVEGALKNYQRKATVPGFRPGKVPTGVIKKMYGKSVMVDEINKLLNDSLYKYINDNKIEILGNPLPKADDKTVIDWDNQKEFEFMYEMGLAPKFEVELSPKEKFTYQTVKIDDELVNKYVTDIAKRYGKVEQVDAAAEGDLLNGDFVELDANGEILPGGVFKTSSVFLDRVKPEAKKAFIGLKVGDKTVINAQDLTANAVDLASMLGLEKEAAESFNSKLQFTVKGVSRLAASEINQELFDKIYGPGNVTTEEEFRMKIREELSGMFVNDSERKFYNDVVDRLMSKVNFNLPSDFLKRWIVAVNEKPVSSEQVESEFDGYAKGLKWQLIENKIIKDNNIAVTKEEVMDHTKNLILAQFGKMQQMPMSDEDLENTAKRVLGNEEEAKKIYEQVYGQKVMTLFKTKFTLENKEVAYDEFFNTAK
ncbi:MAG: trigger factor [Bacteroidetes bacterium]|jgi:trigger factor|nr:trigger factor [Bacteroidota bacterium]